MKKNLLLCLAIIITGFISCDDSNPDEIVTPEVITGRMLDVGTVTAQVSCGFKNVKCATDAQRGACWSVNPSPTIVNNKTVLNACNGSGDALITNLTPKTKYYVRAYINSIDGVIYGNELSFTTLE